MKRSIFSPTMTAILLVGSVALSALPGCDSSPSPAQQGCPTNLGAPNEMLRAGKPFPPLMAEGWFNGEAPTPEELKGQVFVVDVWASWCGPCKKAIPEMITTYEKYKDRGVRFFGLSQDDANTLEQARVFVKRAGVPWPNGYGASTADSLGVEYIPMVFVVGRDGRVVWNSQASPGTLDDAIASALGE
ncbi:MAG TPA: TlpA disulfide reductase family protein [Pirellulales bacterium]|jgi:thiol-disulfide isomerase/thioredoxin